MENAPGQRQCDVCYENFSSLIDELQPRALPCGDIACTRCLEDVMEAGVIWCPLCMRQSNISSVADLPVVASSSPQVRRKYVSAEEDAALTQRDRRFSTEGSSGNLDLLPRLSIASSNNDGDEYSGGDLLGRGVSMFERSDSSDTLPIDMQRFSKDDFSLDMNELEIHNNDRLGEGAFGSVFGGQFAGKAVAIKFQRMPVAGEERDNVIGELSVLKGINHPNLIDFIGAAVVEVESIPGLPEKLCEDAALGPKKQVIVMVTELCREGALRDVIPRILDGRYWRLRVKILREVVAGVASMHRHSLIHRDLKTPNILLDSAWTAKICDYGFVVSDSSRARNASIAGTIEFQAPEVTLGQDQTVQADIFSFGLVICEVMTGLMPGNNGFMAREARNCFTADESEIRASAPPDAPASLVELAVQCCSFEPDARPNAEAVVEWLDELFNELMEQPLEFPHTTPSATVLAAPPPPDGYATRWKTRWRRRIEERTQEANGQKTRVVGSEDSSTPPTPRDGTVRDHRSETAAEETQLQLSGWLSKRSAWRKHDWTRRYFSLKGHELVFGRDVASTPSEVINLAMAGVSITSIDESSAGRPRCFKISTAQGDHLLCADTEAEKYRFLRTVARTIIVCSESSLGDGDHYTHGSPRRRGATEVQRWRHVGGWGRSADCRVS